MEEVSHSLYELPLNESIFAVGKSDESNANLSDNLLDELFMWSILIFSGKPEDSELIKHYWTLTTKPITCALAAMVVYDRFFEFPFVNDELKELLTKQKRYLL